MIWVNDSMTRSGHLIDIAFLVTSDQGSNEKFARKAILNEASHVEECLCLYLEADCFEHSPHLIVASSLMLADQLLETYQCDWQYWGSLAIFANTVREVSLPFYQSYCSQFGTLEGRKVKAIFPKPVSQRWNRIHELESRLLGAGFYQIAVCLADVLASKAIDAKELHSLEKLGLLTADDDDGKSRWHALGQLRAAVQIMKKKQKVNDATLSEMKSRKTVPNELDIEQTKAYTIRMSKWRGQALRTAAEHLWGKMVEAMNQTRGPIMHLSFFIKKSSTRDGDDKPGPLAELVFGKAASIHCEFEELLRPFSLLSCFSFGK